VGELYPKLAEAIQQVHTGRFLPPEAIVMHPRRWAWITAALDTATRPLVTPSTGGTNAIAVFSRLAAGGQVGELQGLPVYTDPNVPTTLGGGTEDEIVVFRGSDMLLYEGPIRAEVFRDVGSSTLTIRFRLYSFVNFFAGRYPVGISELNGSGLAAPAF